jgi:hypothetical protein
LSEYWKSVGEICDCPLRENFPYFRQESFYRDEIHNFNDLDEGYMTDAKVELDLLFD